MDVLSLILAVIALVIAILAYRRVGGTADLKKQIDQIASSVAMRKSVDSLGAATDTLREKTSEAIEKLEANAYDVILMDVNMPEMDGHEATREIRKLGKSLPILALTASVLSQDLKACMDSGMNDYIPKPFKREELLATLSKYYKKA